MTEDQLSAAAFKWIWNTHPDTRYCFFHIPNGGTRNKIEANKFKAMGLLAGVHDYCLVWGGRVYFFEFKVGSNKQSAHQLEFGKAVTRQGAVCQEVRNLEEFQEMIELILSTYRK